MSLLSVRVVKVQYSHVFHEYKLSSVAAAVITIVVTCYDRVVPLTDVLSFRYSDSGLATRHNTRTPPLTHSHLRHNAPTHLLAGQWR